MKTMSGAAASSPDTRIGPRELKKISGPLPMVSTERMSRGEEALLGTYAGNPGFESRKAVR